MNIPQYQKVQNELSGEVCEKYSQGSSIVSLSREYGVSQTIIKRTLVSNRVPIRTHGDSTRMGRYAITRPAEQDVHEVQKMYQDEMTPKEISEHYGVSIPTIHRYLKRHGITKRGYRESRHIAMKKGRIKFKDTLPERMFAEYCDRKGIKYYQQFFGVSGTNHPYDFYIPSMKLIVEVDGDYWHSSQEQKNKDAYYTEMAQKAGYNIIRLSETDIMKGGDYLA